MEDVRIMDILQGFVEPKTDAERLAVAVLLGETEAAFALADEVQMSLAGGDNYMSLRKLFDELEEWSRRNVSRSGNGGRYEVTNDTVRLSRTMEDGYAIGLYVMSFPPHNPRRRTVLGWHDNRHQAGKPTHIFLGTKKHGNAPIERCIRVALDTWTKHYER